MAKDRSPVRASDIGAWAFCHRAWWLARVKRAQHRDPAKLRQGDMVHRTHGRRVVVAARLQLLGWALFLVAAVLGLVQLLRILIF